MKQLILVFLVTLQTIFSSAALAWSPLDGFESAVDKLQQFQNCYLPAVTSDEGEAAENKEEEEEPDCE